MAVLLGLHLLAAAGCAVFARRWGSRALLIGAAAPVAGFGWLVVVAAGVLAGDVRRETWAWAPSLGLQVPLRLDGLGLLTGLVVTGVGAAILLYSAWYFADRRSGIGRTAAVLTFFAGSMLALVLADNLLVLYVAWELTTVCSFLLIGDDGRKADARAAALRALLVTTGAGFPMLLGLILLGEAAGTYQISALLAEPPRGGAVNVAVLLILAGAFAKSAQLPFHPWLPAAMVAPTPVSAYLHAAAMVKAGVYLAARFAPGFADVPVWRPLVLAIGVGTMLLGGWRALAETDLKRLLAFGTIAQLGLLFVLLGAGTRTAALAGAAMLLAHALFKACLFLVVGVIDHEAGTRDLRELSGVWRTAPGLAVIALLACGSMAGLPPTVGYLGKEAAFEAFVAPGPGHNWVLAGVVVGSVLTVAYTLRFLWGAFGERPGVPARMGHALAVSVAAPAGLAAAGAVVGLAPALVDRLAAGHADVYAADAPGGYHLELWHGVGPPLLLSLLTLVAGIVLHLTGPPANPLPTPDAQRITDGLAAAVVGAARALTARTQVGSLPAYLLVVLTAVAVGPGLVLALRVGAPGDVRPWDNPAQALVGLGVLIGAAGVVHARRRLVAVITLSAVGYLVAALFAVHGAPDLALAQVLVESLTLLVFVLVVRRMPRDVRAPAVPLRAVRATVAVLVGGFAAVASLAAGARHTPSLSTEDYFREGPHVGGPNLVNVILTEFRALDTLGEVTVLALAATGVASLVLVSTRAGGPPRPGVRPDAEPPRPPPDDARPLRTPSGAGRTRDSR